MLRAFVLLAALICALGLICSTAEARSSNIRRKTTTTPATTSTTSTTITTAKPPITNNVDDDDNDRYYHPADIKVPRVLEQFQRKSLDGSYEFRYALSNGVTRYENTYWIPVGEKKVLARKGYYSQPLENGKYLTVYYTADENGYYEDSSSYSDTMPVLPKHIEIPMYDFPKEVTAKVPSTITSTTTQIPLETTSKRKPGRRPTRKPKENL